MQIINIEKHSKIKKINLGGGRLGSPDYLNIDIIQFIDNGNNKMVDIVMNVENEKLPFIDNSIIEIKADNVLEHLGDGFIFALNECHRVLAKDGIMKGMVPVAGSKKDFMDITHKRHFILESFSYFCGTGLALPNRPLKPKYADYSVQPFNLISLKEKDDMIYFELKPRKIC